MKKITKLTALVAALSLTLVLAGCQNPASDSKPEEETKTAQPGTTATQQAVPATPGSGNSYRPPVLPPSVGQHEFGTNTYIRDYNNSRFIYKFEGNDTLLYSVQHSGYAVENRSRYKFTYNTETNIMHLYYLAAAFDEEGMLTFEEWKNAIDSITYESMASYYESEEEFNEAKEDYLALTQSDFEKSFTWKVIDSNGTLSVSYPYYDSDSVPASILNSDIQLKFTPSGISGCDLQADFEKNKIQIRKNFTNNSYSITSMADGIISARKSDDDTITLSYTLGCDNGYLVLSLSASDAASKEKLNITNETGDPRYELKNTMHIENFTKQ